MSASPFDRYRHFDELDEPLDTQEGVLTPSQRRTRAAENLFNGDAGLVAATYYFTGTPAATDQVFFVATRPLKVVSISQVHSVAAGGASTLQVTKDTATDAPGAGSDLLDTAFDLNGTANTVQTGDLVATEATLTLAAGDRLAVDYANAIQSSAGVAVTVLMQPV